LPAQQHAVEKRLTFARHSRLSIGTNQPKMPGRMFNQEMP
jgi:hypothetical protein